MTQPVLTMIGGLALLGLASACEWPTQPTPLGTDVTVEIANTNTRRGVAVVHAQLIQVRAARIGRIVQRAPSQARFLTGWLARITAFALDLAEPERVT